MSEPWYVTEASTAGELYCPDEVAFFATVAKDLIEFAGTDDIAYYGVKLDTGYDPVYGEPVAKATYIGPWSFKIVVEEFEEAGGSYSQEATDEGMEREYDAVAVIERVLWDTNVLNGAPAGFSTPREGDVLEVFSSSPNPKWFSVMKVDRHGHVNTSNTFVEWKLTLKERQSMSAERRI